MLQCHHPDSNHMGASHSSVLILSVIQLAVGYTIELVFMTSSSMRSYQVIWSMHPNSAIGYSHDHLLGDHVATQ